MCLFISFLFSISVFSQQEIEMDFEKLNSKVTVLINNHRKSLKLKELSKDTFLQKAAEDHSLYLQKLGFLTHEQKDAKKKNPSDRVKFCGGTKFSGIGENILFTAIKEEKYSDKELDKLAQTIFNQWKNSPPHYKNIIKKDFDAADLGFYIDSKRKRIYATHVFGIKGVEIPNQLSENAFGVEEKNKKCRPIDFGTKLHIGNSIAIEGDNVILYYHDKKKFELMFSEPKDGIALGEEFSYEIEVKDGIMKLKFMSKGHETKTFTKNIIQSEYTTKADLPLQTQKLFVPIGQDGVERKEAYTGEGCFFKLICIQPHLVTCNS